GMEACLRLGRRRSDVQREPRGSNLRPPRRGMGLLLLLGAYLQPYGDSRCSSAWLWLHPGFTPIQYPFLSAFGVPLLGIVLGPSLTVCAPPPTFWRAWCLWSAP